MRALKILLLSTLLASCASSNLAQIGQPTPGISASHVSAKHVDNVLSIDLTVMTYNIAGLPWPMMKNRNEALAQIGTDLSDMRKNGTSPDIVFIQEGFRSGVTDLVKNSGYPYWVRGPSRRDKPELARRRVSEDFIKDRRFTSGETIGKLTDSGLFILSRYPITLRAAEPFGKFECAGFDCAANKGVVWANIKVPGLIDPVQVFTTHLNSRDAAKVPRTRSLEAHNAQFAHLAEFVEAKWEPTFPLIFGGDFNLSGSEDRLEFIKNFDDGTLEIPERRNAMIFPYCFENNSCKVEDAAVSQKKIYEFQDLQGFSSGSWVKIEPKLVRYLFKEPDPRGFKVRGKKSLSDHEALTVTYRLTQTPPAAR